MSKNPKIEFFKIHLEPTPSNEDVTFKSIFKKIYESAHPEDDVETVNDDDLQSFFFSHFFKKIDTKFNDDKRKRKAFYAKPEVVDGTPVTPIKISIPNSTIDGIIKGGIYDTGKDLGDIARPQDDTETLDENNILLDSFYFSLYTPLSKDIGILAIQSYTRDLIADVFVPFVERLFKIPEFTYKAVATKFMPLEMQKAFKQNSIVKKFQFSNREIVNQMENGVLLDGEFTVNIQITSLGNQINLNNLPLWKQKIGESVLGLANKPQRSLDTFNNQYGYVHSPDGKTSDTRFTLDAGEVDITATLFLENYITIEENGTPDWDELRIFTTKTINDTIKPEVYPEDYLNED